MSVVSTIRRSQIPLTRVLVTLFAAGWLGLVVQPCVAMSHDAVGNHGGHHTPATGTNHDCPHCPPPAADHDCSPAASVPCDGSGQVAVSSKDAKPPQPEPVTAIGLPEFHDLLPPSQADPAGAFRTGPPRPPTASIQQRFCSFLK